MRISNLIILFFWISTCAADVITVDDSKTADFDNIQAAVDYCNDGDIIEVASGTCERQCKSIDFRGRDIIIRCEGSGDIYTLTLISSEPNEAHAHPTPMLSYVPNELIVKFKRPVADALADGISKGKEIHDLQLSQTVDKLNRKYKIQTAKALFKTYKKDRQRIDTLLKNSQKGLTESESHILKRLNRVPKGIKIPELDRIYKIELSAGQSALQAVKEYSKDPDVEYAELNYVVSINSVPNDSLYNVQWPLNNTGQSYPTSGKYNQPPGKADCDIDGQEAWDIESGNSAVTVAVVDTGVDYTHRDLENNMWVNAAEWNGIAGFDDDGNGYIDDMYGYDFINKDSNPKDDHGHGTHCSGIIAAEGNNGNDITGVSWHSKIMALKFLGANGSGNTTDAVTAFYYAVNNGADIVSNSWGGGGYSQSMEDAINYAYSQGVIMVAAAGNNNSTSPQYPAYYDHMIAVAATNSKDERAPFSNYGDWVEIAAPGVDILSLKASGTAMGTTYDNYTTIASGTSMACPYVSGAFALVLSVNPGITIDEATDTLKQSADPIQTGICQSGRLNLNKALLSMVRPKGSIRLDRDTYSCSGIVKIEVRDSDLKGAGTQDVGITTDGNDSEIITLIEQTPTTGIFSGSIVISVGAVISHDGILQVSPEQTITAMYYDLDDGTGTPWTVLASAVVDCEKARILDVNVISSPTGRSITVKIETNEPTTTQICYGLSCGGPYNFTAKDIVMSTNHTVTLLPLTSQTSYYFVANLTDAAGNITAADNNGLCYSFTTPEFHGFLVPSVYPTIQAAINDAWNGDIVLVADGTYRGEGNRDIDFLGKSITVKSENGPDNCVIDCNGTSAQPHRAFNFHSQEPRTAVVDGFTIINGYSADYGGGIRCEGFPWNGIAPRITQPTISNCVIRTCNAASGGGISCYEHAFPKISDCVISNNLGGNGIYCGTTSGPEIRDCNIVGNIGSGITLWDCSTEPQPIINNCMITDNIGSGIYSDFSNPEISESVIANHNSGSGIHITFTPVTIIDCIISNNHASGISYNQCSITISNSIITGNSSPSNGGGLHSDEWDGGATVKNCVFIGNRAKQKGGGIYSNDAQNAYVNCTIVANTADEYGGGYYCQNSGNRLFTNCIFWSNSAPSGPQMAIGGGMSYVTISYCDVQGGQGQIPVLVGNSSLTWGTGNINADPVFALSSGDYHQLNISPCIDKGTNTPAGGLPPTDIYGRTRNLDGDNNGTAITDMGAYEFEYNSHTPVIAISQEFFDFYSFNKQPNPEDQHLSIRNCSGGTLNWQISDDSFWLQAVPESGVSTNNISDVILKVDTTSLSHGEYTGKLTIYDSNAVNNPRIVLVKLHVADDIFVPQQFTTIQAAIDSAGDKSTVIVDDGVYTGTGNKDLNFKGKAITVRSKNGWQNCIIDCQNSGRGFVFNTYEENGSVLDGFTIINGYSTSYGGGIYCNNSGPTISNCRITHCRSTAIYGGGVYCAVGSPHISNCAFENNSSGREGGGICINDSTPALVENCTFTNNSTQSGGGIGTRNDNGYRATIKNCLIYGNTVTSYGGGIYYSSSRSIIYGSTVTNNTAADGGALYVGNVYSQIPTVKNCIFWNDSAREFVYTGVGTPAITYSDIQGGWTGSGNKNVDPSFADSAHKDYHLRWNSQCINSGDLAYVPATGEKDIDGEPRIMQSRVDIGSDEVGVKQADLNRDGIIDYADLAIIAQAWLSQSGQSNWYGLADLWQNGQIDFADFSIIAQDWLWRADWYSP